ncbi:MAG: 50S ribosomal protein L17 [Legionellales bacterium]|nr:50S ribosomal protein L17 [Legionellales bacterium]|tara:strand:- start:247 stop:648 length:402 start_codon:yes stop_codon:yes gene_type:complete
MRHRKSGSGLSRDTAARKALMRNMAISLVEHGGIRTTLAKAKALRPFLEPLITKAGEKNLSNFRYLFDRIRNKDTVYRLIDTIGPFYKARPGGYLRIIKDGFRNGDKAPAAYIQFVDMPALKESFDKTKQGDQ